MSACKKSRYIETITLQQVPANEKRSWPSIALIWAGNVVCIPALMVGGMISTGLNFWQSILAALLGFLITTVLMILIAIQAAQTGRPTMVGVARALGDQGASFTLSLIMVVSLIGWYAYQTLICAESFCGILRNSFGVEFPQPLSCILWGALMLVTAFCGIGMTKLLNCISVPLLLVFMTYGVSVALNGSGVASLLAYRAPGEPNFMLGVTLSVGSFISGAITCGDYNRYSKDAKSAALSCFFGIVPFGGGALVCGAVLAICTGSFDITVIFSSVGLPLAGLAVLILSSWTTNVGNAYSAGIAAVKLFNLRDDQRAPVTAICGIIGILLSLGGVIHYLTGFLSLLSFFVTPIAAVLVADYWILGKHDFENWRVFPGVNWLGIVSWLVGAGTTYSCTFFIPELVGIMVTMIVYVMLCRMIKNPKYNPFA